MKKFYISEVPDENFYDGEFERSLDQVRSTKSQKNVRTSTNTEGRTQ